MPAIPLSLSPPCRLGSTPPSSWTTVLGLPSPSRTDLISWECWWERSRKDGNPSPGFGTEANPALTLKLLPAPAAILNQPKSFHSSSSFASRGCCCCCFSRSSPAHSSSELFLLSSWKKLLLFNLCFTRCSRSSTLRFGVCYVVILLFHHSTCNQHGFFGIDWGVEMKDWDGK